MAFDSAAYVAGMTERIEARCAQCSRLYLEVGGHLFFDGHASRVLPGFAPSAKLALLRLLPMKKTAVVCCHAALIERDERTSNTGAPYTKAALQLVEALRDTVGVAAVVVTRCSSHPSSALRAFAARMTAKCAVPVHLHAAVEGYPEPAKALAGFAANSVVAVPAGVKLVLVTGVQANSGKLATCLSQLYHERTALYSKLELFPIHDLPPRHAVNLAYEAATADLGDVVMDDPFQPGSCNYNRDVAAFPLLRALMESLCSSQPHLLASFYSSPTAMGINCARQAIRDEAACMAAARKEIARRSLAFGEQGDEAARQRVARLLGEIGETVESLLPAARQLNSLCLDDSSVPEAVALKHTADSRLSVAASLVCSADEEAVAAADARVNYDWAPHAFPGTFCSKRSFRKVTCLHLHGVDWSRYRRAHFHLAARPDAEEHAFLTQQVGAFVTVALPTARRESRAQHLARQYGMVELPAEGCLFAATERTELCSTMLGLLVGEVAVSRFHRLAIDEVWNHYEGAPVRLVLLLPGGAHSEVLLGGEGTRHALVAAGTWMAAHTVGEYSFFGCTCSPPWQEKHFETADAQTLIATWPAAADDIRRFT